MSRAKIANEDESDSADKTVYFGGLSSAKLDTFLSYVEAMDGATVVQVESNGQARRVEVERVEDCEEPQSGGDR